jgi:hypothetical protein
MEKLEIIKALQSENEDLTIDLKEVNRENESLQSENEDLNDQNYELEKNTILSEFKLNTLEDELKAKILGKMYISFNIRELTEIEKLLFNKKD